MPIQRFSISTEHMNDNRKRGLTLFLEIFTFRELNLIFHKHVSIVFSFAVCKNCKAVILFSLNVVVEVTLMSSNIRCSSKLHVLTVLLG